MASKWVYRFSEGNKDMKELLGGKGANLAEMTTIGLPVPPGFTITTEVCNYYSANESYPEGVDVQLEAALAARARAFTALAGRDFFEDAVTAYDRCAALSAKDVAAAHRAVDASLFAEAAERELAAACDAVRGPLLEALAHLELESALKEAAGRRPAVDKYFVEVRVMDDDPAGRGNRLAQLAAGTSLIGRIGEFSRLPATQT